MLRKMKSSDGPSVLEIYAYGLETRMATFETKIPTWVLLDQKWHKHSRFVYEQNGRVAGWVALIPVSNRDVYRGVAEVSIYVSKGALGKGIGSQLMRRVIQSSEQNGIWTLYASMFPENTATVRLHQKCGFRKVGIREKIACLDSVWRDTLIMERRSKTVGV
jgi:phosphinothricin acetyltransferase